MSLLIQKGGILSTVQDLGRDRFRRFGINPSGAMDPAAARLANILVGNDDNRAVIETHFPAVEVLFDTDAVAAIGGADFTPALDGKPIENWRPFFAAKGSVLKFTGKSAGNRAYLAIRGGIAADRWLDSASTNLAAKIGGHLGRKLEPGDQIDLLQPHKPAGDFFGAKLSPSVIPHYRPFPTVRIIPGAEYRNLSNRGRNLLLHQNFTISNNSNRMGFRLVGDPVTLSKKRDFISAAVSFGTIQTLPDGQLIVLMADHQTAGGYPRIGHVISRDLPLVAQLGTNDKIAFHLVDSDHAENLALEFERDLSLLRVAAERKFA